MSDLRELYTNYEQVGELSSKYEKFQGYIYGKEPKKRIL